VLSHDAVRLIPAPGRAPVCGWPFRVYTGSEIWCSGRLRQPSGAPCTSRLGHPLRRRLRPAAIPHQQVTDAGDVGLL
jgi:hypothetical protein